jgi:hypothetical protein
MKRILKNKTNKSKNVEEKVGFKILISDLFVVITGANSLEPSAIEP